MENPAPGIRAGNVHLKIEGNKYFYNPKTGFFYTRKTDKDMYLPVSATKNKNLLRIDGVLEGIKKALHYLGE